MEDNLKILNVEYLGNHWSDLTQIFNISLLDQTNEDDLQSPIEYLSNHLLDLTQILNLSLGDQTKLYECFK